jgi:hypothetical protein
MSGAGHDRSDGIDRAHLGGVGRPSDRRPCAARGYVMLRGPSDHLALLARRFRTSRLVLGPASLAAIALALEAGKRWC